MIGDGILDFGMSVNPWFRNTIDKFLHISSYIKRTKDDARNTTQGNDINATSPGIETLVKPFNERAQSFH